MEAAAWNVLSRGRHAEAIERFRYQVEVWMPRTEWNGNFEAVGNGWNSLAREVGSALIVPYLCKKSYAATEPDLTPKTLQNVVVLRGRSKNGNKPAGLKCREWRLDREGFLPHSRRILP